MNRSASKTDLATCLISGLLRRTKRQAWLRLTSRRSRINRRLASSPTLIISHSCRIVGGHPARENAKRAALSFRIRCLRFGLANLMTISAPLSSLDCYLTRLERQKPVSMFKLTNCCLRKHCHPRLSLTRRHILLPLSKDGSYARPYISTSSPGFSSLLPAPAPD